jgi:hypothetical protein
MCRVILQRALQNWLPNALLNGATNWHLQSRDSNSSLFWVVDDVERSEDHRWQHGDNIQPLEDTWKWKGMRHKGDNVI